MKTFNKVLTVAIIVIATTLGANAQSGNTDPNANYKHQIPTSKGNKFKDSFNNDHAEDVSVRNYKQQNPRRTTPYAKSTVRTANPKVNTVNSKHPYGL